MEYSPGVALLARAAVQGDRRRAPAVHVGDNGVRHVLPVKVALQEQSSKNRSRSFFFKSLLPTFPALEMGVGVRHVPPVQVAVQEQEKTCLFMQVE